MLQTYHLLVLPFVFVQIANAQLLSREFQRTRRSSFKSAECQAIMSSVNAQFFEQHVLVPTVVYVGDADEEEESTRKAEDEKTSPAYKLNPGHTDRLERIARTLRSSVYAKKICDPNRFHPHVLESDDSSRSCFEICASCFPGSAAVCHQRNHRFPNVAQSCFCTYDVDRPLHKAVFVLKNGLNRKILQ